MNRFWELIVTLITFRWLRRRPAMAEAESVKPPSLAGLAAAGAVKVKQVTGDALPRAPKGFGPFKAPISDVEVKLQKAAVNALFDRLGAGWIPIEYWDELRLNPDPIQALVAFCGKYNLRHEQIGAEDTKETARFQAVVGLLMDIGQLEPDLDDDEVRRLHRILTERRYSKAEAKTRTYRKAADVIRRVASMDLPYGNFRDFRAEVVFYRGRLSNFAEDDVDEANKVLEEFVEFDDVFRQLVEACNERIAYVLHHWPDNDWGKENLVVSDGMIAVKEAVERRVVDEEVDMDQVLTELNQVRNDLDALIAELQAANGDTWSASGSTAGGRSVVDDRNWALDFLGFASTATPDSSEINSAYRKLAFKWHPDRNPGNPDAAGRFKQAGDARAILERGKSRA